MASVALPPLAGAEQSVGSWLDRTYATGNKNLDIDGVDDERVDVDVAVLDSGVELDHPDLNIVAGVDCTAATEAGGYKCDESPGAGNDDDPDLDELHGTLTAKRLAAIDNDIEGVGTAPGARIWAVDVVDGLFSQVGGPFNEADPWVWDLDASIAAVKWVTKHANQIEVMIGGNICALEVPPFNYPMCPDDPVLEDELTYDPVKVAELNEAIADAVDAGVVYVMAASPLNRDVSSTLTPSHPDVITVSFMADWDGLPGGLGEAAPCIKGGEVADLDDTLADNSNWGKGVDIAAPSCSGSGAQPQVAGAAAILASSREPSEYASKRKYVESIRDTLVEEGNHEWVDDGGPEDKGDGYHEPLLDLHDEAVFDPETVAPDAWLVRSVPNAESANNNRLTDVSCTSASFCFATANLIFGAGETSYAYGAVWNGNSWKLKAGLPENSGTVLSGVSCTSPTYCIAVGHEVEANGVFNLALSWDGTKWTRLTVPNAGGGTNNNRLTDVSCTSASHCFATANLIFGAGATSYAYGVAWDGSSWKEKGGLPENEKTVLNGVSCTSSTSCLTVGHEIETSSVINMAVSWNGTKWTRLSVVSSGLGKDNRITDVSCTSASFCFAIANVVNEKGVSTAYAGIWNGSSWVAPGAVPDAEATALSGVSCTSSTSCAAVGHRTEGGKVVGYAARWSGGASWTREEMQNEPSATDSRLSGVSCATDCITVGSYTDPGGVWNLAEHAP
ncbi:MAG TPA: hypothetical protein VNP96_05930 [Solirubrobacterales bacterium]|nr:hypothetical protein [Solirubrobacterales bacterium]